MRCYRTLSLAPVTTPVRPLTVGVLRELLRHLQAWESLFLSHHIDTLTAPDGQIYHLLDIQYLYSCRTLLSPRQREAIELCLYNDTKEKDATLIMGVSPTNPVAMYATNGLVKICSLIESGQLPRYRPDITDEDRLAMAAERADQDESEVA